MQTNAQIIDHRQNTESKQSKQFTVSRNY